MTDVTIKTGKTAHNRGRTDRISVTHGLDPDLWPSLSIPWELWSWAARTQKFKVSCQSLPKIDWIQTDGQTNRRTEMIVLPLTLMRSIIITQFSCCSLPELSGRVCNLFDCAEHRQMTNTAAPRHARQHAYRLTYRLSCSVVHSCWWLSAKVKAVNRQSTSLIILFRCGIPTVTYSVIIPVHVMMQCTWLSVILSSPVVLILSLTLLVTYAYWFACKRIVVGTCYISWDVTVLSM